MDDPQAIQTTATGWSRELKTATGHESGGSQPHVFHTDDGEFLIKTENNPQGSRVLSNELVAGLCLDWLGVAHPEPAVVDIPQHVIDDNPGAKFNTGERLQAGKAFGSKYCSSDPGGAVDASLVMNTR